MGVVIKYGSIVTASRWWRGDIRCRDGRIVELAADLEADTGDEVVDAAGQYVFPGGVDPHVHMALPVAGTVSADDFESGTAAGLAGGTTTIIDFVHPDRGEDFLEALAARHLEARLAVADYGLHMAVTWWGEETAAWMARCVEDEGIPSFKVYMAYLDTVGIDDGDLARVMEQAGRLGALVVVHAEDGDAIERRRAELGGEGGGPELHPRSRPPEMEGVATERALALAHGYGASAYIFHVTCREAVAAISAARGRGEDAFGETCPHYLLLDDSVYRRPGGEGAAFVVAPPIRAPEHQETLWGALEDDTLQVVSTDHCPFTSEQKASGRDDFRLIPGGAAGIEHRLTLLYTFGVATGRLDLHRFVDLVSTRPAKLFGLYPRKGAIAIGADADLVVWDPAATATISAATHHHRTDQSVFGGFELTGLPSTVVANGEIRYQDGDLRVESGAGRFLPRSRR